jgi:hypothetical protein
MFSLGAIKQTRHLPQELGVQRVHHLGGDVLAVHLLNWDGLADLMSDHNQSSKQSKYQHKNNINATTNLHMQIHFVWNESPPLAINDRNANLQGVLQPSAKLYTQKK